MAGFGTARATPHVRLFISDYQRGDDLRCQIHTAVWGTWHTDAFTGINLPSLMAAGNLPAMAARLETSFIISTRRDDAKRIERSSSYRALQSIMPVKIDIYRDGEFGDPIATHKKLWRYGLKAANEDNAFCIFNPPDIVWADGCYATMAERILAGKKVIYANFPRALEATFVEEANARHRQGEVVSIAPRAIVDMMLRHQHPLNAAYLRNSDQFPHHAEYVIWPVAGEGLMMRTLANVAFGMDPAQYEVGEDFLLRAVHSPEDIFFPEDSDLFAGVSLAPLNKDQTWYATPRGLDIDEVSSWWLAFDDPAFLHLAQARFYLHSRGTDTPAWRRAKQMSDFFIFQAITGREIVRLGRILRANGCSIAAGVLATAHFAARLRRRWRWRAPVSIVVPDDAALSPFSEEIARRYLTPGCEDDLIDFVFGHVAEGRAEGRHSMRTINGGTLSVAADMSAIGGATVRQRIALPQGKELFIVDRPLAETKLASHAAAAEAMPA